MQLPTVLACGAAIFYSQPVYSQMDCGSVSQAVEQVTLEVLAPAISVWGPYADAAAAAVGVEYTESPADIFNRCWREATEGEEEEDDGYYDPYGLLEEDDEDDGWSWGDPHLVTLDGLAYDFHGAGDFVLVEHAGSATTVQTRYVRASDDRYSAQQALAIKVGDRVVTLFEHRSSRPEPVVIDGTNLPFRTGGWYEDEDLKIQQIGGWIFLRFTNGLAVASASGRTNRIHLPSAWAGQVRGLLGDNDGDPANDIVRRNGDSVDVNDANVLYGVFLDDWNIAPGDSLFAYPFDVATLGPVQPGNVPALADLPADAVASARDVCQSLGLLAGQGLEACMFDVALTGDSSWATTGPALQRPVLTADVLTPNVTRTFDLVDGVVQGSLEAVNAAHEIRVPAVADDVQRVLRAVENCDSILPAAVTVVVDGRARVQRSLDCSMSVLLPSASHSLLVLDSNGGAPDYALRVIERTGGGYVDAGALLPDQPVRIPVAETSQQWRWTLDAAAVPELFFPRAELSAESNGSSACAARWSLRDVEDQALSSGSLCVDAPRVSATGAFALQIDIPAGVGATFLPGTIQSGNRVVAKLADRARFDGVLGTPGQVDTYTLHVDAGTNLLLMNEQGDNHCGVVWSVLENGLEIFRGPSCFDTDPISIESEGDVEVRVEAGSAGGQYNVEIVRVPDDRVSALALGNAYDASIDTPGERVAFTFAGNAGSEIVLADTVGVNNNCRITWRVLGPSADEAIFKAPVCFDTDPVLLRQTGEHILEVVGERSATGPVSVTVFDVPEPTVSPLKFGITLDGSIVAPGARVHFPFSGSAGDALVLREPNPGNDDCGIVWRIIRTGTNDIDFEGPVCFDSQPITIRSDDEYILEIDGKQARVGQVGVIVERQ